MHGGVRISFMHFRFAWSANLGLASWHLKETVAHTRVYRVNALINYGDGDPDQFHHIYWKKGN